MTPPQPTHVAVDRALQVLSFLGARPGGASLAEVAAATGIPKPSVHRTLTAMRARGYATQPEPGGPYLLGRAALEAAFTFHAGLDLRRLLRPLADRVRDRFGQTCHVAVLEGAQITYVEKVEAHLGVRLTSVVGGRNPAHATAVGKALLAAELPDDAAVRDWVRRQGPLAPRTASTATTATALAASLEQVRRRGWALDDEESEEGLVCVGTCVPLVFGALVPRVAVSVSGLRPQMVRRGVETIGAELCELVGGFEFAAADAGLTPG